MLRLPFHLFRGPRILLVLLLCGSCGLGGVARGECRGGALCGFLGWVGRWGGLASGLSLCRLGRGGDGLRVG